MPLTQKELKKGLSTLKIPKIPTPLNVIVVKRECDPIIDVQCNRSMLHGVLVDGTSIERCRVYYMGEGGGFPRVRAVVSLVCPSACGLS